MKKATKIFEIVKRLISSPGVIRELFDEEAYYHKFVLKKYKLPHGLPQTDILSLLPDFAETVEPFSFLDGTSLPIDIAILKGLARSYKDCRYLEIGTWRGESAVNVAEVAGHAVTINLPDRTMLAMGLPPDYVSLHRHFSKGNNKIEHIQHDSQTFDFAGLKEKSDLIFIDGNHHYEFVKKDTINAFNQLAGENGTIVWHDYAISPETIRWTVLAGILDGCPPERRKFLYHVSNTLCAIYTTRPLVSGVLKPFQKPDKFFSVSLKAKKA